MEDCRAKEGDRAYQSDRVHRTVRYWCTEWYRRAGQATAPVQACAPERFDATLPAEEPGPGGALRTLGLKAALGPLPLVASQQPGVLPQKVLLRRYLR